MRQRRAAGFIILMYRAGCGATTFLEVRIHFNHAQLGLAGEQLHERRRGRRCGRGQKVTWASTSAACARGLSTLMDDKVAAALAAPGAAIQQRGAPKYLHFFESPTKRHRLARKRLGPRSGICWAGNY